MLKKHQNLFKSNLNRFNDKIKISILFKNEFDIDGLK